MNKTRGAGFSKVEVETLYLAIKEVCPKSKKDFEDVKVVFDGIMGEK